MIFDIGIFIKMTDDGRENTSGRSTYCQNASDTFRILSAHHVTFVSRSIITVLLYKDMFDSVWESHLYSLKNFCVIHMVTETLYYISCYIIMCLWTIADACNEIFGHQAIHNPEKYMER